MAAKTRIFQGALGCILFFSHINASLLKPGEKVPTFTQESYAKFFKDQESTIRSEISNRIRTKKGLNDRITIKRIHIDNPGDTRDIIMFLTYFENFYPLEYAINLHDTKLIKQLLDAGASPNISFRKPIATYLGLGMNPERPALYWATDLGLAIVKLMIKKGANINAPVNTEFLLKDKPLEEQHFIPYKELINMLYEQGKTDLKSIVNYLNKISDQ